MKKFIFSEKEHQTYLMDVRMFIEGTEVTYWLQDDIGTVIAGTGGENSLSFTLANPEDIWILTPNNVKKKKDDDKPGTDGIWRVGDGPYQESAKKSIFDTKNKGNVKDSVTNQWLYPLGPWQSVFNKHDCVRLFVRNPTSYEDLWMPAFTGFINTYPWQEDYIRGARPLSFQCFDMKGFLKKMRVCMNPAPIGGHGGAGGQFAKEIMLGKSAEMFLDLNTSTGLNHPLAGKNFERALMLLLLGEWAAGESATSKRSRSIFGGAVTFALNCNAWATDGSSSYPVDPMTVQEAEVLDEFTKLNLENMVKACGGIDLKGNWIDAQTKHDYYTNGNRTPKEKELIRKAERRGKALAKAWEDVTLRANNSKDAKKPKGEKTEDHLQTATTPDNRTVHKRGVGRFLRGYTFQYPGDNLETWHNLCLLGNRDGNYLTYDQVTQLGKGTIKDSVVGSPFNGYVHLLKPKGGTPAGTVAQIDHRVTYNYDKGVSYSTRHELIDTLCNELDYQWYVTPGGDIAVEFPMFDFTPDIFGSYKNVFMIDLHATSASMEDEATDIPTGMVVTGQEKVVGDTHNGTEPANAVNPLRAIVYSPILTARLGANIEEISAPVAVSQSNLEAWASLQLEKRIGQSSTLSMPAPWRPWILPNRPYLHTIRDRMGLIQSITHAIAINGQPSTQPNISFVRKKEADGKYRYMTTGGENMPINYATYFTGAGDLKKSGVRIAKSAYNGTSQGQKTNVQQIKDAKKRQKEANSDDWPPHFPAKKFACNKKMRKECPDNDRIWTNLRKLAWQLETISEALGHPTFWVSSAYRSPSKNLRVGGVPSSRHMRGMAADLVTPTVDPVDLRATIIELIKAKKIISGGVGLYIEPHRRRKSQFVHYDIRGKFAQWWGGNVRSHPRKIA